MSAKTRYLPGDRRAQASDEARGPHDLHDSQPSDPAVAQARLDAAIRAAGRTYQAAVRNADLLDEQKSVDSRAAQLSGFHEAYVRMMALECIRPLGQTLGVDAIIRSATMGAAMWALSPKFKEQMGKVGDQARKAFRGFIVETIEHKREAGKPIADFWQKRLDAIERDTKGRNPFTAYSAALSEVSLNEASFRKMRLPGADQSAVLKEHNEMVQRLYQMAAEDGIKGEDIARSARMIVGRAAEDRPEIAAMYNETAHGAFVRSADRDVLLAPDGRPARIWDGGFEHVSGVTVSEGSFGVRPPMSLDEHEAEMARTMAVDLLSASSMEDFHMALVTYAGMVDAVGSEQVHNNFTADPAMRRRVVCAERSRAAMALDGFDDGDTQYSYTRAFALALRSVHEAAPGIEQDWVKHYSKSWTADVAETRGSAEGATNVWQRVDPEARRASGDQRWSRYFSRVQTDPSASAARFERAQRLIRYNQADTGSIFGVGPDNADISGPPDFN